MRSAKQSTRDITLDRVFLHYSPHSSATSREGTMMARLLTSISMAAGIVTLALSANAQTITINQWDSLTSPPGWEYSNPTPAIDGATNTSDPSNALRFTFPAGYGDGNAPSVASRKFTGQNEFWYGFWLKYSSNWQWHPIDNKITYGYLTDPSTNFYTSVTGGRTLSMVSQTNWKAFVRYSSNSGYNPVIAAGQWYWLEIHVRINTPGASDGLYELWLDDGLVMSHNNVAYRNSNILFGQITLFPIWGGSAGAVKGQTDHVWYDYTVISTSRIGMPSSDKTPPSAPRNLTIN